MSTVTRRSFAVGGIAVVVGSCVQKKPDTPLAHLYGRGWVEGAYTHYAEAHQRVEGRAQTQGTEARQILAQRGVSALAALQVREVPFWVRVSPDAASFRVERDVPERLTFTANMSQAARDEATRVWSQARDHIQKDYEDVRRLDAALGGLLGSVSDVRHALDAGRLEQFRLCRQLTSIDGGEPLSFELPYQVSRADYGSVLLLLLERLESDAARLRRLEASLVATGLTARAADSGSLSLSQNLEKVLLSVEQDAARVQDAATAYPTDTERARHLTAARAVRQEIAASPEYSAWLQAERDREDVIGQFLTMIDRVTGLPTSAVYQQILRLWRGDDDYLGFLRLALGFVPGGTALHATLDQAVHYSEQTRSVVATAEELAELAKNADARGAAVLANTGALNVATKKARQSLNRQLVFFESTEEVTQVRQALENTALLQAPR